MLRSRFFLYFKERACLRGGLANLNGSFTGLVNLSGLSWKLIILQSWGASGVLGSVGCSIRCFYRFCANFSLLSWKAKSRGDLLGLRGESASWNVLRRFAYFTLKDS